MESRSYKELRKGGTFGQKLRLLVERAKYKNATDIATALYENSTCYGLVHPRTREKKYQVNRKSEINAIAKRVLEHIDSNDDKEAYEIPSNYMLAYSILFHCSLDYLYGLIDNPSPNAEIRDISEKTGLSSKAVENLCMKSEVYLEGFIYQNTHNLYSQGFDPEAHLGVSKFWSDLLESKMFLEVPENWARMAFSLQIFKATQELLKQAESHLSTLPERQEFFEKVDEYYATHEEDPCMGDSPYDIYDNDPDRALTILREIDGEKRYEAACDLDQMQTVYWGSAGMFDRQCQNYFHDLAENFEIPRFENQSKGLDKD